MSPQEDYAQRCEKFDAEMHRTLMVKALEKAYAALNYARRFNVPSLGIDSYDLAAEIGDILVKELKR